MASAARRVADAAATSYALSVPAAGDVWIPLVDEPIGAIVRQIEAEHDDVARLARSPGALLAFRTFAYIRVGLVLGQLLVDNDLAPYDGSDTWVEALLRSPEHRDALVREVLAVAEEVAADTPPPGRPRADDAARERLSRLRPHSAGER